MIAVVGPNGAGKSTLFKGIVGMLKPLAGGIDLCGLRARDIAYLPQVADIDRTFPISVYDMVAMGLWREAGLFGGIGKRERDKVRDAMSAVGLSGFEERPIGTLSGGQMQRTLFARLLLQDARVIVLDEPFNAIDTKTAADLCDLVRRWHAEKRTVIAALHDLELVKSMFPEALLLAREPVAWGATKDVLTAENLLKARRMCEAFDEHAASVRGVRGFRRMRENMIYDTLIAPFVEFAFMRRALVGTLALALGAGPVGVFLMLRRMSLVGDAMAHAILPGAAIGFLRLRPLAVRHDGGRADRGLRDRGRRRRRRARDRTEGGRLARGVLPHFARGRRHHRVAEGHQYRPACTSCSAPCWRSTTDTLLLIAGITTLSLVVLAVIYRPLVLECVDPGFLRSVSRAGAPAHIAFLALVVMNLVGGFHALGTLLAVGIMMLPAVIGALLGARCHRHDPDRGRSRRDLRLRGPAGLVPFRRAVRARDHPGRGRALCGLGPVRPRRRVLRQAFPADAISKREVRHADALALFSRCRAADLGERRPPRRRS